MPGVTPFSCECSLICKGGMLTADVVAGLAFSVGLWSFSSLTALKSGAVRFDLLAIKPIVYI